MSAETRPGSAGHGTALDPLLTVTLVASLCAIYAVSQFLRNSVGVLAPELSRELGLTPEAVGLLSSVFFLSFAAAQIPLGMLLDRYGPKVCVLLSVLVALVGAGLFASARSLSDMVIARALMGLGCSSFLMGPLMVYARWFSPAQFSTMTGIQVGLGTLGTLFATAPLAYGAAAIGWRATFLIVAGLAALAGLLVLLFVRDDPPGSPRATRSPERIGESVRGLLEVLRTPDLAPLFAMHFVAYSSLVAVLGLWGGPYLSDVYGFGIERRGELLFLLAVANVAGIMAWGPLDRWFGSRKRPVVIGGSATAALLFVVAFGGPRPGWLAPLFVGLGFANGYFSVLMAHGRALFPDRLVGRGITLLNMASMAGTFVVQLATGIVVGLFPSGADGGRPAAAYEWAFAVTAATLAAALAYYALHAEDRPPGAH